MSWTKIDSNFVGQVIVTGSGTNVRGPDLINANGFWLKPSPSNSVTMWIYNHGTTGSGFPMDIGENFMFVGTNLNMIDFGVTTTSVTSASMCWAKV
jgi:hypothetical protein